MSKRIDQQTFRKVKRWTHFASTYRTAMKFDLHPSTVMNIRGCKDFGEYRSLVHMEHPPVKYSLADDVLEIHRRLFEKDNLYIPPLTAKKAMMQILEIMK